jgi:hypothetical protein
VSNRPLIASYVSLLAWGRSNSAVARYLGLAVSSRPDSLSSALGRYTRTRQQHCAPNCLRYQRTWSSVLRIFRVRRHSVLQVSVRPAPPTDLRHMLAVLGCPLSAALAELPHVLAVGSDLRSSQTPDFRHVRSIRRDLNPALTTRLLMSLPVPVPTTASHGNVFAGTDCAIPEAVIAGPAEAAAEGGP